MRKASLLVSVLMLLPGFLFALPSPVLAVDDPPGRVARLNYIQGSISFQPGGETDWVQANANRPLTTGDNLWADRDSRGELHIDSSSIRIAGETGITFLNLDDRTVQIQLAQGSMNISVRRLDGGDAFEVDTPNLAFTLQRPGNYRIDVDPDGNATSVTVREGEGDATGGGSEYHMDSGDQATFTGTDSLTYDGRQAGAPDEFDRWSQSRDEREERSQSARYVSRDVIGYDDLDDYGEWRNVPDYGNVWFPTGVAAGWAPYRFGHWAWIEPWGWTWVEDEPWGFAPFHYGRWAEVGGGWCWVPGPVVVRPVYAPALVAFVGGPRFSMSLSIGGGGGVAWFPLGPREVYVPPYRTSERYVQRVNVTNTTVNVVNVTNVYNNVNVANVRYMHQNNAAAVTAVSHDTFVNARAVGKATIRVNPQQIQTAEIQRNIQAAPVRRSIVGAGAAATVRPPEAVMRRQVVVKETPAPPRASFNGGQQPGRTFSQAGAPRQQQPAQRQPQFRQQIPPQQQPQIQPQQRSQQQQSPVQQQPQIRQQQSPLQPQQNPRPQQQTQQQQARPQAIAPANPPQQRNPNIRFAPPAHANEDTYRPHQFEKPPNATPPQNQRPQPQERAPQPPQQRRPANGPEPNKQDDGDKKNKDNGGK